MNKVHWSVDTNEKTIAPCTRVYVKESVKMTEHKKESHGFSWNLRAFRMRVSDYGGSGKSPG
jgi:hypothetical protein